MDTQNAIILPPDMSHIDSYFSTFLLTSPFSLPQPPHTQLTHLPPTPSHSLARNRHPALPPHSHAPSPRRTLPDFRSSINKALVATSSTIILPKCPTTCVLQCQGVREEGRGWGEGLW